MTKRHPAVNDPLEGVKLEPKGKMPPPTAPEPVAVVEAAAPAVLAPPAPAAPVGPVKRYRVKAKTTVSHFGQLIVMHPDDVLTAESYGDAGLARLLESVPCEEL